MESDDWMKVGKEASSKLQKYTLQNKLALYTLRSIHIYQLN